MIHRLWMPILLCLTLACQSFGQSTDSLSLRDLVIRAIQENESIQVAQKQGDISALNYNLNKTQFQPQVNFSGSYFYYWDDVPNYVFRNPESTLFNGSGEDEAIPLGLENNLGLTLSFRQRVLDLNYFGNQDTRGVMNELQKFKEREAQEEVVLNLAEKYFRWMQLNKSTEAIAFNNHRLDQLLAITRIRIQEEMANAFDSLRLLKAMGDLNLEARRLDNSKQLLETTLLMEANLESGTLRQGNGLSLLKYANNDTLVSAKRGILESAKKVKDIQYRSHRPLAPTLDFFANLSLQSQSPTVNVIGDGFTNNISLLGLQLDIPLYNGAREKLNQQKVTLEKDILDLQIERLSRGESLLSQKHWQDIQYFREKITLESRWIESLDIKYQQEEVKWQQGVSSLNDLLIVNAEIVEAKQQLAELTYALRKAELDYLRAGGGLIPQLMNYEE